MPLTSLRPAVSLDFLPGDILVLLSDGIYEYHDTRNELFGEARVEAILKAHHGKTMADLAAVLLEAVQDFAQGAPQEDDLTVVLVKREAGARAGRTLRRSFDALEDIFAFTSGFFTRERVDPALRPTVDLTLEELFTNMVKYSPGGAPEVRVDIAAIPGGVEVTLTDYDVERFDVTAAPDADVDLPIGQRKPGGLGLHLIRRLVDSMTYEYSKERRQSRITFRKTSTVPAGPGATTRNEGQDADD